MCWGCPVSDGQEHSLFLARTLLKGTCCLPVGCWGTKPLAISTALADSEPLRSSDCKCKQWKRDALRLWGFFLISSPIPSQTIHTRLAIQSQPDGPIVLFPQNVLLAVNKLIPSTLWCFLFKLFRQSSSINFHFEMQLAFAVVGTQSSGACWGKHHLLFTSVLSPAFIWLLFGSSGEGDSERLPLFHLLRPLMPEQTSFAAPSAVSKFLFAILLLIPHVPWCRVRDRDGVRHGVRHGW